MKKFIHPTHKAYEIRRWESGGFGIVLIRNTGNRINISIQFNLDNIHFHYSRPNKYQWFAVVRMPFFLFEKDNCGFKIGTQNRYLWVIK